MSTRSCTIRVTIFRIILTGFKFTELHALTLAAHSYVLLLQLGDVHSSYILQLWHGNITLITAQLLVLRLLLDLCVPSPFSVFFFFFISPSRASAASVSWRLLDGRRRGATHAPYKIKVKTQDTR